jgi:6-phosphogluconolactonase
MKKILIAAYVSFSLWSCHENSKKDNPDFYLFVGAYTQSDEEGIETFRFSIEDGSLEHLSTTKRIVNPSYLAIDESYSLMVAVNEVVEYKGGKSGSLSAFRINPDNGQLMKTNEVASGGGAPCYVSLNKNANMALVANYVGGNVAMIPIDNKSTLLPYADLKQHVALDSTADENRVPHAHAVVLDPGGKFALVADLGLDMVISYEVNLADGMLTRVDAFETKHGAGPRHLVFHPTKSFVYIINELNSSITACRYVADSGRLVELNTVQTLPENFEGQNSCADIHISHDGKFLYGSNRGHDSIVVFSIDSNDGDLHFVGHHSVQGATPRNFMIDPTDQYLLVANQNSDNIVVFERNRNTGRLQSNGVEVKTYKPVCLKMMPIP